MENLHDDIKRKLKGEYEQNGFLVQEESMEADIRFDLRAENSENILLIQVLNSRDSTTMTASASQALCKALEIATGKHVSILFYGPEIDRLIQLYTKRIGRQTEMLKLMQEGYGPARIARILGLSSRQHVHYYLKKFRKEYSK